jgi:hypothetical protein
MPGVIRTTRGFSRPLHLKGFRRGFTPSYSLLASSVLPSGIDEIQTVTIGGGPTGGTFTLTYAGQTTSALAFNAAANLVEDALEALSTIGNGNVRVTGSAGGPYSVTFLRNLGRQDIALMTATGSFTGGTSPTITVAEATKGDSTAAGELLLQRGTILTVVPGNTSKVRRYTAQGGEAIIGVADRDVLLLDGTSASDVDIAVCRSGFDFNAAGIVDYATYQSAFATWCATVGSTVS